MTNKWGVVWGLLVFVCSLSVYGIAQDNPTPPANPNVTGKGVVNFIPVWDTTSGIVDSIIFQKTGAIGINTTAPAATLDVNGKGDVRDTLTLFPKSTDNTLAISGTLFKVSNTDAHEQQAAHRG